MEHAFAILKTIIMTYNEHDIKGYKSYMYDGFSTFISTKTGYLLYFNEGSMDSLHTPYGKIRVSCGNIDAELYKIIYGKILMRLKGIFITPSIYIIQSIHDTNDILPYPLLKSRQYTDDEITKTFYIIKPIICAYSKTNGNVYNYEIERLVSLGIIHDVTGMLKQLKKDDAYFEAIDAIFTMHMYTSEESNQFRRSPRVHKYAHILGLLLLTDTPIKGVTY
jgi:hypothetical protein